MGPLSRKCFAEFLGVFILCSFGNGSVAQAKEFSGQLTTFLGINLAYGPLVGKHFKI